MQPKPLTKVERETLMKLLHSVGFKQALIGWVPRLLGAEQFWREAVKNVNAGYPIVFNSERNDSEACALCEASANITKGEQLEHKPDCAWVLANES